MIALDSDIYSLYLFGNESIMSKIQQQLHHVIALPVVVAEEALRGRLNAIRSAQSEKKRDKLPNAYARLAFSINSIATFKILAYTSEADILCEQWKRERIKVTTRDMRIAAICVSQGFRLVTRNIRDFNLIPNLNLETWN